MKTILNKEHIARLFNAGVLGVSDTSWLVDQGYYLVVYAGKVVGIGGEEKCL